MTERTCGNCAWFDDRDKIECIDGIWVQGQPNGPPFNYIGPGRCMREPVAVPKEPHDWCRHHATTREWAADANEPEVEPGAFSWKGAEDEITRLRARCREAREILRSVPAPGYADGFDGWGKKARAWLEASDDA